jgi:hypothetical protein
MYMYKPSPYLLEAVREDQEGVSLPILPREHRRQLQDRLEFSQEVAISLSMIQARQ